MCTLSWQHSKSSLEIYFSRDEQRTRPKALPPAINRSNHTSILAPKDPLAGGTWIAANNHGIAICILNDYSIPYTPSPELKSRGLLVNTLAEKSSIQEICQTIEQETASHSYAPFTLAAWHADTQKNTLHHWNQKTLTTQTPPKILTSSSWNTPVVENHRKKIYNQLVTEQNLPLHQFHLHQDTIDLKSSVCMSREKSKTVSLTKIKITPHEINMEYAERDAEKRFLPFINTTLPK